MKALACFQDLTIGASIRIDFPDPSAAFCLRCRKPPGSDPVGEAMVVGREALFFRRNIAEVAYEY